MKILIISWLFLGAAICQPHNLKNMEADGVVPDVIEKVPPKGVEVTYNDKKVDFGNELTPTQVKDEPKVSWEAEKDAFYTLAIVDPDAPSRKEPKLRHVRHWLVVNIPGSDVAKGEVVTAYIGSGPPKGTGLHRYVFLVYKQSGELKFDEPKTAPLSRAHRLSFDLKKFVAKYKLGEAIAGNFYKAQWDAYVDVRNKLVNLETQGIVPDVIDRVPPKSIEITYNDKKVGSGNELTPTQVKDEPKITWDAEKDAYYTLLMTDPDAPSRKDPNLREVNHWLVTNILGNDLKSGEVITAYFGSGPFKNTDLHRYVFLVFKQPKKITFDEPKTGALSLDHRLKFSTRKFAEKYHLGNPVAGNFFTAQWDEYVEERMKLIEH